MQRKPKSYQAPSLEAKGDAVSATRMKLFGALEPSGVKPKEIVGGASFGL
ncbi:MAG TPA: hypothetical protein VLD17_14315 [Gemmatimonadaceae bacterium]|jgi:hypothetical protein|nr:hypothetical protein [Gemmatimonadaceae bacterium]